MTISKGRMIPNRFAPSLIALFLACSALTIPAHAGWLFGGDDDASQKHQSTPQDTAKPVLTQPPATDIEGNVRQAHMLRLAGQYKEAIHHLAQLMLVASDDGRVVAEYGKTLARMGRAQDAVSFLTRASQLRADDWTIFSALGVAFDELGEQDKAKKAYERALALKPDAPVVLNNYAFSRLLAHDPQGARALAGRIRAAGPTANPKIARNLAMIADMAGAPKDGAAAASMKTRKKADVTAKAPQTGFTVAAPATKVAPPTPLPAIQTKTQVSTPRPSGVVMQKVPADPLAGPVGSRKATAQPHMLVKTGKPDTRKARIEKKTEKKVAENDGKAVRNREQIRDSVPDLRLSANAY